MVGGERTVCVVGMDNVYIVGLCEEKWKFGHLYQDIYWIFLYSLTFNMRNEKASANKTKLKM